MRLGKILALLTYYGFARFIPMQPFPGAGIGYVIRRYLAGQMLAYAGPKIIIKDYCYFGDGGRLSVGARSQLGQNARLNDAITIGAVLSWGRMSS